MNHLKRRIVVFRQADEIVLEPLGRYHSPQVAQAVSILRDASFVLVNNRLTLSRGKNCHKLFVAGHPGVHIACVQHGLMCIAVQLAPPIHAMALVTRALIVEVEV